MRRTQICSPLPYSQNYTSNFINKTIDKWIGLIQIAPPWRFFNFNFYPEIWANKCYFWLFQKLPFLANFFVISQLWVGNSKIAVVAPFVLSLHTFSYHHQSNIIHRFGCRWGATDFRSSSFCIIVSSVQLSHLCPTPKTLNATLKHSSLI